MRCPASAESYSFHYKLRDVVALTGFSKQVLYAWEQRYPAMSPRRARKNPRLYSDTEVHRLQLLRTCISGGHKIGQLAALDLNELKQLARACDPVAEVPLGELLLAVQSVDVSYLESHLSMHFATLGPVRFTEVIAAPLMAKVGSLWQSGQLSVAAEHCVSAIIRTLLGQALRHTHTSFPGSPGPSGGLVIFSTPENELHELGALAAATLAQTSGLRTLYMGAQLPFISLALTARTLGASAIGLSSAMLSKDVLDQYLSGIMSELPPEVEVWVGGHAFSRLRNDLPPRASYFDDVPDYLAALRRHCIRTVAV